MYKKKYYRLIFTFFIIIYFSSCSSKPAIIRVVYPVTNEMNNIKNIKPDFAQQEKEGVLIQLEYLNKIKLKKLMEENNPYIENNDPILSVFKIKIKNKRNAKIEFDIEKVVIIDDTGYQCNALTYDAFRSLYPSTVYRQYEYRFLFDRYYKIPRTFVETPDERIKAGKSLFKGGKIYAGARVEGLIVFPRISESVKKFKIIIPDIKLYKTEADTDNDNETELKKIDFTFEFIQKIKRVE